MINFFAQIPQMRRIAQNLNDYIISADCADKADCAEFK